MPFTFVDVEASRSRKVWALFATLVAFYFAGAVLLFAAAQWDGLTHVRRYGLHRPAPRSAFPPLRTLPWILGFSVAAAGLHWTLSVRRMIPRILEVVGARTLDPEDARHRVLANVVAEVSAATGGRRIEAMTVATRGMNAFALSDLAGRSVIGVSESLLVRLDRRQLEAVVAHEASHLLWGDCVATTISCSMAAVWAGLLRMSFPDRSGEGSPGFAGGAGRALPMLAVIVAMRGLTYVLNVWISRQREHRADATAVRLTRDPLALAQALHLISSDWRAGFRREEDLAPIFIVDPRRSAEPLGEVAPQLFSTHPPPRERIAALLALAHADERALRDAARPTAAGDDTPYEPPGAARRWMALEGAAWRGPLAAAELVALPWVTLQTQVRAGATGPALAAWEHPELNVLLRRRASGDSPAPAAGCPACGGALEPVRYEGVPLRRCAGCGGRLVRRDRFVRVLAREERPASDQVRAVARQLAAEGLRGRKASTVVEPGRLACPDCGRPMTRALYHAVWPTRVEIDRCEGCELLWFDTSELELIEHLTSTGGA